MSLFFSPLWWRRRRTAWSTRWSNNSMASPTARLWDLRLYEIGHKALSLLFANICCALFPCRHPSLTPSVWKQEPRRSWCSTSSTPFHWETLPSSPSSSPPIDPSPPQGECWTSSLTGGDDLWLWWHWQNLNVNCGGSADCLCSQTGAPTRPWREEPDQTDVQQVSARVL